MLKNEVTYGHRVWLQDEGYRWRPGAFKKSTRRSSHFNKQVLINFLFGFRLGLGRLVSGNHGRRPKRSSTQDEAMTYRDGARAINEREHYYSVKVKVPTTPRGFLVVACRLIDFKDTR